MRMRTIQRRLKLSMLPQSQIQKIFDKMKNIPDEKTILGAEKNKYWTETFSQIHRETFPKEKSK